MFTGEFFMNFSSEMIQAAEAAGNIPQRVSGLNLEEPSRRTETLTTYLPFRL